MYVGHASLALLAKSRRPRVALALLVPVAFAPDWIQWICDAFRDDNRFVSHSLVSVGIGASIVALVYLAMRRGEGRAADALVVWLTYASHWPADFITGTKPTWPRGPYVGLMLYGHLGWDALLECVLALVCWYFYRRSLPPEVRKRAINWLIPFGLIGLQILFAALQDPAFLTDG